MFKSILVAVDGSAHSNDALAAAISLAKSGETTLCVVTVPQPIYISSVQGTMSYPLPFNQQDIDNDARKTLDAALAAVPADLKKRTITHVLYGDPARAIVEKATEISSDLIVLGRRGLGSFAGLLLGSTTAKVSQLAPCAVLTLK